MRVKTIVTQFLCYKCFSSRLAKSFVIEEFVSAAGYSHALALYMKYMLYYSDIATTYFAQSNEPCIF